MTNPKPEKDGETCKPSLVTKLGGGFKDFLFSPLPGEMIHFD